MNIHETVAREVAARSRDPDSRPSLSTKNSEATETIEKNIVVVRPSRGGRKRTGGRETTSLSLLSLEGYSTHILCCGHGVRNGVRHRNDLDPTRPTAIPSHTTNEASDKTPSFRPPERTDMPVVVESDSMRSPSPLWQTCYEAAPCANPDLLRGQTQDS
jgi:hypothetical protein